MEHKYEEREDIMVFLKITTKGRGMDLWEQVYIQKIKKE
jgi:hypothetical protein